MGISKARWITSKTDYGKAAVYFRKQCELKDRIRQATLWVSARGVYEIYLNETRVGDFFLAPGWTNYNKRIQYQQYDVTELICEKDLQILAAVGDGWYRGRISVDAYQLPAPALIASLEIVYADGSTEQILTDESWESAQGQIRFNDIYDGEVYDARFVPNDWAPVRRHAAHLQTLIPQEGPVLRAQQHFKPISVLHTPKGETVLDFGQNLTGYTEFSACGKSGEEIELTVAETLDKDGNLYRKNYIGAQTRIHYISNGEPFTYHSHFTFYGFRYVRVDKWPEGESFTDRIQAVAAYSDMERTGWFHCSNSMVNAFYQNVLWGQKSNFLDVPTDCPQRDERMGWTGDAQVFCKTASYNFNVEKFFLKWMRDVRAEQRPAGYIPQTVPRTWEPEISAGSGWGDAVVICPWQLYQTYGEVRILEESYDSMCRWVEYIRGEGTREDLWDTGVHFGDWLAYDGRGDKTLRDPRRGKTSHYLVATAYYYYSTTLVCKAGDILGKDTSEYKALAERIKTAYFETFLQPDGRMEGDTQTSYILSIGTGLADGERKKQFAARLAEKIRANGNKLDTGFLGTPWILSVLADNGYMDLAVTLLLQTENPSWLYSVTHGGTTMWEEWDGVESNVVCSLNHYAYGAAAEFLYEKLCGIEPASPGFRIIRLAPKPDKRFDWAEASIHTRYGMVRSGWKKRDSEWQYQFEIPAGCEAEICLGNNVTKCGPGVYEFFSHIED